jgi:radical SAM enzyme (TIGR01210 family)
MIDVKKQIRSGSEIGGKTYSFNDDHDQDALAQMWFQDSTEGLVLFTVFYTQACRWSRCIGCNLPSICSSSHIDYRHIINQVDGLFSCDEILSKRESIRKMIVSNNGSVLDQATFSSTALIYLVAKANINFPGLRVFSIETRPEYVDLEELEFLARALSEGEVPTELELAIGFEAFDEKIRNEEFMKGLSLDVFEGFVKKMSKYRDMRLKCYFMQKPVPGMTDEEGVSDIIRAINYLSDVSARFGVSINMHLNPTYVASGTRLEKSFRDGLYSPPRLVDVAKAVCGASGKGISIFVGLFDEGLAIPGGGFIREGDERLMEAFVHFNKTQDFSTIKKVLSLERS